jgi:UPF0755 protein
MNDIRPPKRPTGPPKPSQVAAPQPQQPPQVRIEPPAPQPLLEDHASLETPKKRRGWKWPLIISGIIVLILAIAAVAGFAWYQHALSPVSSDKNANRVRLTIETGTTPSQIGSLLVEKKLIRSQSAFDIYTRLSRTQNKLQAGSYRLSPAESTQDIVKHLVSGNVDEFTVTFYPGATLTDTTSTAEDKKVDVTTVLKRAGYSESEITTALKKTYDHPLFADKPASTDLEGYIYGETYSFSTSASVEDILVRTFDEFYAKVKENNLVASFQAQGLNLYQGITLASIIQREVPGAKDQKQVAQVFLKRYREGMALGSDITAYYGADKLGERRTVAVDSPYNTRIHAGLPPGPIAAPGLSALIAVANPAPGDYLFFLSGDDDVTYFARTGAEHDANIANHCAVKCAME